MPDHFPTQSYIFNSYLEVGPSFLLKEEAIRQSLIYF